MKTIVDRQTWLRGDVEKSLLRNGNGEMCCLGFRAIEGGEDDDSITGAGQPLEKMNSFTSKFFDGHHPSKLCEQMMSVNDSNCISDDERERTLQTLFGVAGESIEFIN